MFFKRPPREETRPPYPHVPRRENRTRLERIQDIMDKLGTRYCIECGIKLHSGNPWIACIPHTREGEEFTTSLERLQNSLKKEDEAKAPPP